MHNRLKIPVSPGKKLYFASDIHLGEPDYETSRQREARLISWIDSVEKDAAAIFFVGDMFDFWFEYRYVVPKGYVRLLGRLAQLTDKGMPIYIFTGNHDLWMKDYFIKETGAVIYRKQLVIEGNEKNVFVAHGDGLGPGDYKYKLLKKVFTNKICRWLFSWLHPDIGIKIAALWSRSSRQNHDLEKFEGPQKEWLVQYALKTLEKDHYDYFVFGHRHIPIAYDLNEKSRYFNLGDWIENNTYGEFDGTTFQLKRFVAENG